MFPFECGVGMSVPERGYVIILINDKVGFGYLFVLIFT